MQLKSHLLFDSFVLEVEQYREAQTIVRDLRHRYDHAIPEQMLFSGCLLASQTW